MATAPRRDWFVKDGLLHYMRQAFYPASPSRKMVKANPWETKSCAADFSLPVYFKVTFEAKGLDSVLGENTNEEEEEELMAGMSAIVFDVQLRPVVFFQGYTDLMAKVLLSSGEPTNVIKGNVLLMDHQQVITIWHKDLLSSKLQLELWWC